MAPAPNNVDQLGQLVEATSDGSSLTLVFENHSYANVPHIWFRDGCPCAHCVSESSGQKTFATCDIDATPQLESCKVLEDGALQLVWAHDFLRGESHTSLYPLRLIQRRLVHKHGLPELYLPERYLWDRADFEKNMEARAISYDAWMAGGEAFAKSLLDLCQWGLVFVRGVPESIDAVKDIANKIGVLQSTFYGETWDVISKPNAENVAYTNEFLGLHQDLMYYKDFPYVQLLHCMKNDCEGGDSLFSDGLRAAAEFKYKKQPEYLLLSKQPVNFQYSRNGHFYRAARRVIFEPKHWQPQARLPRMIHWSPPFQGPFVHLDDRSTSLPAWRDAARAFKNNLEAPENMLQYRLQPGDCVLFDNTRILHGRTEFDTSSGTRRMHGTYLQKQTVTSALRREIERGHLTLESLDGSQAEVDKAAMRYGDTAGQVKAQA